MWTERAYEIDEYIRGAGEIIKHSRESLFLMGEAQVLDVYRIPIKYLSFNISNGRFKAEKKELEKQLGFELDPMDKDHDDHFIKLLLPKREKSELFINLEKYGQIEPAIITADGFLINANRRLACMKLGNKINPGKYEYLNAHRLDASIPPKEIYKLEVQIQMKNDLTEKYNPINEVLKIKEGLELMSPEELMETYEWNKKDLKSYQKRLQLIDGFLEYIDQSGNYTQVFDFNEHFVEIEKELNAMKRMGLSAIKRDEALDLCYAALKVNVENKGNKKRIQRDRIRNIREAFIDENIYKMIPKNLAQIPTNKVYHNIIGITEVVRTKIANDKPIEHLKQALNHLNQISIDNYTVLSTEFEELFIQIKETVAEIEKTVGEEQ